MSRKKSRNKKAKQKPTQATGQSSVPMVSSLATAGQPSTAQSKQRTGPLLSRRRWLQLLVGAPVGIAVGVGIHRHDVNQRTLHNLADIGQGLPVIVQIHDPACSSCRQLMSNTRTALDGRQDLLYRVADITSREGAAFQKDNKVPNITLLLFDAKGNRAGILQGVLSAAELAEHFETLANS